MASNCPVKCHENPESTHSIHDTLRQMRTYTIIRELVQIVVGLGVRNEVCWLVRRLVGVLGWVGVCLGGGLWVWSGVGWRGVGGGGVG